MQAQPLWEAVSAKTERAARRGAGTKGSVDGAERSTALASDDAPHDAISRSGQPWE
jgi:hypothetical protein